MGFLSRLAGKTRAKVCPTPTGELCPILDEGDRRRASEAIDDADLARDSGEASKASGLYSAALALNPARNDLRVQLGNMLKDSGDPVAAIDVYQIALACESDEAIRVDILLQMARALTSAGQIDCAIEAYEHALALAPEHCVLRDERARLDVVRPPPQRDTFARQAIGGRVLFEQSIDPDAAIQIDCATLLTVVNTERRLMLRGIHRRLSELLDLDVQAEADL